MTNVFAAVEGAIHLYTGATAQSGNILQYAENLQVRFQMGWANDPSLYGVYRDHQISQRVDLSIGGLYAYGDRLEKLLASATAIHAKLIFSSYTGTAGFFLMSGRIDDMDINLRLGDLFRYGLQYHANIWSAF